MNRVDHALERTPSSRRTGWLFAIGVPFMAIALILQSITLKSGDYRAVLISALIFTSVADGCFVAAFIRGGLVARCASLALMLPTLFVVADFVRRAPYVFP